MKALVKPSRVWGRIQAPQSKSLAIRYVLSSLMTNVELFDLVESEDVIDAMNAVAVFGVKREGARFLKPVELSLRSSSVFIRASATVLRMLIPIAAVVGGRLRIDVGETLRRRPIETLISVLSSRGIRFSSTAPPLVMEGRLRDSVIEIEGGESSQYVSGFMYAFALSGGGTILLKPPTPSKNYVYLTAQVLSEAGVNVKIYENRIDIDTPKDLKSISTKVPGDFLLASFYVAASLLTGGEIEVYGLPRSGQPYDPHIIVNAYRDMGAYTMYEDGVWRAKAAEEYKAISIDVDQDPDLAPSVAALASVAQGDTVIENARRLRIKESDRVETLVTVLRKFGVVSWFDGNNIHIVGGNLKSTNIACPDDHRVAMLAAVLATRVGGEVDKAECVNKSNPSFWADLLKINARVSLNHV